MVSQLSSGSGGGVGFVAAATNPVNLNFTMDQARPRRRGRGRNLAGGAAAACNTHQAGGGSPLRHAIPARTAPPAPRPCPPTPCQIYSLLLGLTPLPDVMSLSWGVPTQDETAAAEASLAALAARGVTVIASSGDGGAFSAASSGGCGAPVAPTYPAASPFVTAAGAVAVARLRPGSASRIVTATPATGSIIVSGGGFGTISTGGTAPNWQAAAVNAYAAAQRGGALWPLQPGSPNVAASGSVVCNGTGPVGGCWYGRGYPDGAQGSTACWVASSEVTAAALGCSAQVQCAKCASSQPPCL
jgi:hypothetical protein